MEFLRTDERHECSDSESTSPKGDKQKETPRLITVKLQNKKDINTI